MLSLLLLGELFSQPVWNQAGGTFGGTVEDLVKDNSGNIFAATLHAGIFKSTDGGSSWNKINTGLTKKDVYSLTVNSANQIFAGTKAGVIFRSDDGTAWTEIKTVETFPGFFPSINTLAVDENDLLFAGTAGGGVYRSSDNGTSWQQINNGLASQDVYTVVCAEGYVFAGTDYSGIYYSTNSGDTWASANSGLPANPTVKTISYNGNNLFASVDNYGIYRLDGVNWIAVNTGLTTNTFLDFPYVENLFSTTSGCIFAGTSTDGIFVSRDNGESWQQKNNGMFNPIVYTFEENINGKILTGLLYAGVYSSDSSSINWTESNLGFAAAEIKDIEMSNDGTLYSIAYGKGILNSHNDGLDWSSVSSGLTTPFLFTLDADKLGNIFAGGFDGQLIVPGFGYGFLRSTDNGLTWNESNNGISSNWVNKISVNNFNNEIFISAFNNSAIYHSTDHGENWNLSLDGYSAHDFAFTGSTIFASILNEGIYRSTDNGGTWLPINNNLPSGSRMEISGNKSELNFLRKRSKNKIEHLGFISSPAISTVANFTSLAVDENGRVFAASQGIIYTSDDNGETWTNLNVEGLPNDWIYDLQIFPEGKMYARCGGVYRSNNGGKKWKEIDGLVEASASFFITPSRNLLAGTNGNAIFRNEKLSFPYMTFWGANDDYDGTLFYYSLDQQAQLINTEGSIDGIIGEKDIEDIAIDSLGNIYFINNVGTSQLYKIDFDELDMDPSTPVEAMFIGDTYLPAGTADDEITGLHFVNEKLIGVSKRTKIIYEIDKSTGSINPFSNLNYSEAFRTDGITKAADGKWYLLKTFETNSEIWRLDSIESGILSFVAVIPSSGKIEALTSHPNGKLYAADDNFFYEIDLDGKSIGSLLYDSLDIEGIDFNYFSEVNKEIVPTITFNNIGTITDVEGHTSLPREFSLSQNYPNPFNPSTLIRFTMPTEGKVKLEVYSVLGEKVSTLVDEFLSAGSYEKNFSGVNLSSGIYIYKLEAGNFNEVKKMMLVK